MTIKSPEVLSLLCSIDEQSIQHIFNEFCYKTSIFPYRTFLQQTLKKKIQDLKKDQFARNQGKNLGFKKRSICEKIMAFLTKDAEVMETSSLYDSCDEEFQNRVRLGTIAVLIQQQGTIITTFLGLWFLGQRAVYM